MFRLRDINRRLFRFAGHKSPFQFQQIVFALFDAAGWVAGVDAEGLAVPVDQAQRPHGNALFQRDTGQDDAATAHDDMFAQKHIGMGDAGVLAGYGRVGHRCAGVIVAAGIDGNTG